MCTCPGSTFLGRAMRIVRLLLAAASRLEGKIIVLTLPSLQFYVRKLRAGKAKHAA